MTAIAHRRAGAVAIHATLPAEPTLPHRVAHALAASIEPVVGRGQHGEDDPGHYVAPPLLSEREWDVAQQAACVYDAMLAPVTVEHLAAWLMPVNAASRNPQSPQDFRLRVEGIAAMVDDLPAAAFTAETRRRLATGFFPSHEDVRAAVEPVANQWQRKRDALRGLRKAAVQATAPRPIPSEAERASILATAAAFRAEMAAKAATKETRPIKAMPLHPRQLLEQYERLAAEGNQAAATRAQQLRDALDA